MIPLTVSVMEDGHRFPICHPHLIVFFGERRGTGNFGQAIFCPHTSGTVPVCFSEGQAMVLSA